MMQSMFSGLAGMRTQQRYMDVIGNNIANVNTTGYKAARVTFEDLLYQSIKGASNKTNPVQVGVGSRVGAIDTLFGQGTPQSTGNTMDLAIVGDGFLVLEHEGGHVYTRSGSLSFDPTEGYLVHTATGARVQGWTADSLGVVPVGRALGALRVAPGMRADAKASTGTSFSGLFDARLPVGSTLTRDVMVVDSLGRPQLLTVEFTRDTMDDWSWCLQGLKPGEPDLATGTISFDANGQVTAGTTRSGPIVIDLQDGISTSFGIELDFSACRMAGGETSVGGTQVGGVAAGTLKEIAIDENGQLVGVFSNGVNKVLGQLALATFANSGGLARNGSNLFVETLTSGSADTRSAPGSGRGKFNPGSLEMSNVDLTNELASMILSQRAFQANSRLITTTDELLQEVINLKR